MAVDPSVLIYLKELLGVSELSLNPGQRSRHDVLNSLRCKVLSCRRCELHETKTHYVFGQGNPYAGLVFVGEAPGQEEDRTGIPFVGRAGALLNRLLREISVDREYGMYICNVLKCRPPGNRDPRPGEIESCSPYLTAQLDALSPKVICALGRFAASYLLDSKAPMRVLRGRVHRSPDGMTVVVTYHPAYLLRNPGAIPKAREDFRLLRETIDSP
jgi:DNA polymerase